MVEDDATTSSGSWPVYPLIIKALQYVWAQQDELKRQDNATAVAERLTDRGLVCRYVVRDEMTHTVLKVFPTKESMEPFLGRLCCQHGTLEITQELCRRDKKGLENVNHLVSSGGMHWRFPEARE